MNVINNSHSEGSDLFPSENIKIFDIEVAPNYFLLQAYCLKDTSWHKFEQFENQGNLHRLKDFINKNTTLAGYNNSNYDNKFVNYILYNDCKVLNQDLYDLSRTIIKTKRFEKPNPPERFKFKHNRFIQDSKHQKFYKDSIDLIIFTKGKTLKECGVALDHLLIEDIVFDPDENIKREEISAIKKYCQNDVEITVKLFHYFKEQIQLRYILNERVKPLTKAVGYKDSFLSKADPAIAQDLMAIYYCYKSGVQDEI